MKASDSTNSLTGLTDQVEIPIEKNECFICLDEMNEKNEPLVDSSLLRTCGCRFKVHPECWNVWMVDKTEFDCPICRKKSLTSGKYPVPAVPPSEWTRERIPCWRRPLIVLFFVIFILGSCFMIYEIVKS